MTGDGADLIGRSIHEVHVLASDPRQRHTSRELLLTHSGCEKLFVPVSHGQFLAIAPSSTAQQ